jgi:hypothetical protein
MKRPFDPVDFESRLPVVVGPVFPDESLALSDPTLDSKEEVVPK